jgi:DNA-binding response OmpR family regulator
VLFISGPTGAEVSKFYQEVPGGHFLEKPFDTKELQRRVRSLLNPEKAVGQGNGPATGI